MIAAIALGSNLGDREENLRGALRRMAPLGVVTAVSTFHDTAPVGFVDQPRFLNAAALLETDLPPLALLQGLLQIEKSMGRDRATVPSKGPRVIDLDVLLMGDAVLQYRELTLPHPAMQERAFVVRPLAEIAPKMLHPVLQLTVAEIAARLP